MDIKEGPPLCETVPLPLLVLQHLLCVLLGIKYDYYVIVSYNRYLFLRIFYSRFALMLLARSYPGRLALRRADLLVMSPFHTPSHLSKSMRRVCTYSPACKR